MNQYDNTDRGVLFKNTRKEKDSHPDYNGSINVGGTEMWLSAWIKQGKNGPFMSLSVKPKDELRASSGSARRSLQQDMDDDTIPFAPEWRG